MIFFLVYPAFACSLSFAVGASESPFAGFSGGVCATRVNCRLHPFDNGALLMIVMIGHEKSIQKETLTDGFLLLLLRSEQFAISSKFERVTMSSRSASA